MGGIVIELQRDALDDKISIESLIRKAYFVAKKLKLKEFEEWLNQEQNGYKRNIPEYRSVGGEIKAWNPYRGWIPIIFSARVADVVSRMPLSYSISVLLDLYNSGEDPIACLINGEMTEIFNDTMDFMPTKYAFFASKSELYRIMSTVRNKILDWALLLEESGIVGEDMTFTDLEKRIAQETPVINQYSNNFYAPVSDVDMKQG